MAANKCRNPKCEYFHRTLPDNAKVCPMCGTALGTVNVSSTPTPAPQPPLVVEPVSPAYVPPRPTRLIFRLFHSSGREFRLPGEAGYIGRRGQTSRTPEIDLAGIPNEEIVSRSHARVYWDWSQNAYILIDNNSRNGTYLNGNLLPAGVPYRLNHGDSLQLGQNNLVCFTIALM